MPTFIQSGAHALATALVLTSLLSAEDAPKPTPTEAVVEKPALTLAGASAVLECVVARAQSLHTTGSIAVVDAGGQLLAFARVDGSFPGSSEVAIGKARTAALFEKPTANFEEIIKNGRTSMLALDHFTPLKGGVPIRFHDMVIGAVGVSGAASADQDEELATLGAATLSSLEKQ